MPEILTLLIQVVAPTVAVIVSYLFGKKRQKAEVDRLQGEKKNLEAAAGLSTAEAASIISRAAADVVQPLTNRIRELQEEAKSLADRHAEEMRSLVAKYAELEAHVAVVTRENIELKSKIAYLEARLTLLSKPGELATETSKRLGEV